MESYLQARRLAFGIVVSQFGVSLVMAALFLLMAGRLQGWSALAGGMIGTVASLYMAFSFFRGGERAEPQRILRGIYAGEFVKLVMTAALFAIVIVSTEVAVLPLFLGYAATLIMYWLALLRALPATN